MDREGNIPHRSGRVAVQIGPRPQVSIWQALIPFVTALGRFDDYENGTTLYVPITARLAALATLLRTKLDSSLGDHGAEREPFPLK